ncbi:hypothetical protein LCGC14_1150610 [marine sediment metagenome]|uniref:Uncharacterized protein n=1 Tax=marine sediment metagenome TaxID=412755 RepID=A0A0F9LVJ5_9ZZZZ
MKRDAVSRYMRERRKKIEQWQGLVDRAQGALDVYRSSGDTLEDLLTMAGELVIVAGYLHRSVAGSHIVQPPVAKRALGGRKRSKKKKRKRKRR